MEAKKKSPPRRIKRISRHTTVRELLELDIEQLSDLWDIADRKKSREELREKVEKAMDIKDEICYERSGIVDEIERLEEEKKCATEPEKVASLDAALNNCKLQLETVEIDVVASNFIDY